MNAALPVSLEKSDVEFKHLLLEEIAPDIHQDRRDFDTDELQGLADSIASDGVQQPIIVRVNADGQAIAGNADDSASQYPIAARYTIIAGERRWRASKLAGKTTIPALIRFGLTADDVIVIQAIENLQRSDLKLPEQAGACVRLVQRLGLEQAAKRLAKSKSWVSMRSNVIGMPAEIRELVQVGVIKDVQIAHKLHELKKLCYGDGSLPMDDEHYQQIIEDFTNPGPDNDTPSRSDMEGYLQEQREALDNRARIARTQAGGFNDESEQDEEQEGAARPVDPDLARRQQEHRDDFARRSSRHEQIKALDPLLSAFADDAELRLTAALGHTVPERRDSIDWDKDLPLTVRKPWLIPNSSTPIPDAVENGDYTLEFETDAATYQRLQTQIAEPLSLSVRIDGLTPDQAAQIEAIAGSALKFDMQANMAGTHINELIERLTNSPAPAAAADLPEATPEHLAGWIKKKVKKKAGARLRAADAYTRYCADCAAQHLAPLPLRNHWGRAFEAAGIKKMQSNGIQYIDVVLA